VHVVNVNELVLSMLCVDTSARDKCTCEYSCGMQACSILTPLTHRYNHRIVSRLLLFFLFDRVVEKWSLSVGLSVVAYALLARAPAFHCRRWLRLRTSLARYRICPSHAAMMCCRHPLVRSGHHHRSSPSHTTHRL
jgi:hypothetical protein